MSVRLAKDQDPNQGPLHQHAEAAAVQVFKQSDKGHLQFSRFVATVMVKAL
jgi:hypothetical protein